MVLTLPFFRYVLGSIGGVDAPGVQERTFGVNVDVAVPQNWEHRASVLVTKQFDWLLSTGLFSFGDYDVVFRTRHWRAFFWR